MPPRGELADQPADISLSEPKMLAKAYRDLSPLSGDCHIAGRSIVFAGA